MGLLNKLASIKQRMAEPSTQAGLSSLAIFLSMVGVPKSLTEAGIQLFGAVTGIAAVFMKEKSTDGSN